MRGGDGSGGGGGMSGNDVERNKLRRMRQSDVLCEKYRGFLNKHQLFLSDEIISARDAPKARLIARQYRKELRCIMRQIMTMMLITFLLLIL